MTYGYLYEEVLRWVYAATMAPPYFTALIAVSVIGLFATLLYRSLKEV